MSGRNWDKARLRSAISRHGSEAVGADSAWPADMRTPGKFPRKVSKEDLRRQADALLKTSNVTITRSREVARYAKPDTPKRGKRHARKASGIARYVDVAVPAGLVVYADGCCEPNPGVGGWGFVAYRDGVEVHSEHGGDSEATNQRMEMVAAIRAVLWITANLNIREAVRLISDSAYVVNGSNDWRHKWKARGWRKKTSEAAEKNQALANLDLWKALDAALTVLPIELEWVKGHCGIIGNERADELSQIGRGMVVDQSPTTLDLIKQQLDYSARGG